MPSGPPRPADTAAHPRPSRSEPERTCVGCRVKAERGALLRVVAVGDTLALDVGRRLPGRGAHLHPDLHCLELAERRRAFPRALRRAGALDAAALRVALGQVADPRTTDPREG